MHGHAHEISDAWPTLVETVDNVEVVEVVGVVDVRKVSQVGQVGFVWFGLVSELELDLLSKSDTSSSCMSLLIYKWYSN